MTRVRSSSSPSSGTIDTASPEPVACPPPARRVTPRLPPPGDAGPARPGDPPAAPLGPSTSAWACAHDDDVRFDIHTGFTSGGSSRTRSGRIRRPRHPCPGPGRPGPGCRRPARSSATIRRARQSLPGPAPSTPRSAASSSWAFAARGNPRSPLLAARLGTRIIELDERTRPCSRHTTAAAAFRAMGQPASAGRASPPCLALAEPRA